MTATSSEGPSSDDSHPTNALPGDSCPADVSLQDSCSTSASPSSDGASLVFQYGTAEECSKSHTTEAPSVFDIYTNKQRYILLSIAAAAALLLPFTDTIYLPALTDIEQDFHTSQSLVAVSISIYMIMVGIFALVWGVLLDRFGRRKCMVLSAALFAAFTLVCVLAPSIDVLIVFRAVQGAAIGALMIGGQAMVSDVFPLKQRGIAMGIFTIPILVGPVVGPLIGGGLSQAFGWRSTFVGLEVLAVPILLMIIFLQPETHHYFVLIELQKKDPAKAARVQEAGSVEKPLIARPWAPLLMIWEGTIAPHAVTNLLLFACMFVNLTMLPIVLALQPYNLSQAIIGVCYLPGGVGLMAGCIFGGKFSDVLGALHPHVPDARLLPSVVLGMLSPLGLLIFGWSFYLRVNIAGGLVGSFLIGLGQGLYMPGLMAYMTGLKQQQAAAVSAGMNCLSFCMAGVLVSVAVPLNTAMGMGPMFTLFAGLAALALALSIGLVLRNIRAGGKVPRAEKSDGTASTPV